MGSIVGTERVLKAQDLTDTLKDKVWGLIIEGVEYDIQFLGKMNEFGEQIVKVKKRTKP